MINLNEYGFFRLGAAVPKMEVGNPFYNVEEMVTLARDAYALHNVKLLIYPELGISGYTCADLFFQSKLIKSSEEALSIFLEHTADLDTLMVVGMPVKIGSGLYNCGVAVFRGKILGVVPKSFLPNYNEFYEKRWFSSAFDLGTEKSMKLCGQIVPVGIHLLFENKVSGMKLGIEICEDLWSPLPPSTVHCLNGANVIANLSASNESVGKSEHRKQIVKMQSSKCNCAYVYVSSGQHESTTDLVFSGHSMIAEMGSILSEMRYEEESRFITSDVDLERVDNDRIKMNSTSPSPWATVAGQQLEYRKIGVEFDGFTVVGLLRKYKESPFVSNNLFEQDSKAAEIMEIQATGLCSRLQKSGIKKVLIGISGGLDSTLALLVTVKAFEKLKLPTENIIGISMPGFGTTERTYTNSIALMQELGISYYEISIKDACLQHFKDIGHPDAIIDLTFENVQARERTQILMDMAGKMSGLVVGTGNLSELALGWCTYNGDHMSMYGVNSGVPKTLVRHLVRWSAGNIYIGDSYEKIRNVLLDIVDTPISPELLPPDEKGEIDQKTENVLGSYDLHDFFLYYMVRFGFSPNKLFLIAKTALGSKFSDLEIKNTMRIFYKRFFSQQYKRSCMPDGPKVGSICLSPRGDWRMASDSCADIWLDEVENLL